MTLPLLLEMLLMIAVTSFLRWLLVKVVQGDECDAETDSDREREPHNCSEICPKHQGLHGSRWIGLMAKKKVVPSQILKCH